MTRPSRAVAFGDASFDLLLNEPESFWRPLIRRMLTESLERTIRAAGARPLLATLRIHWTGMVQHRPDGKVIRFRAEVYAEKPSFWRRLLGLPA